MPNFFDHYVFDLDETVADSRYLKPLRDKAWKGGSVRDSVHDAIGKMTACEGMPELLAKLRRRGGRLTVLTNSWHEYARRVVAHLGLEVDEIVGAAGKPSPAKLASVRDAFLRERPGASCAHVGDSVKDLRASVAADVRFALCLWGELDGAPYRPSAAEAAVLLGQPATSVELRRLLTKKDDPQ